MQTDKYCAKNIFFEYLDTVTMGKHIWTFHRAENQIQKKTSTQMLPAKRKLLAETTKTHFTLCLCKDASKREKNNNNNKLFKVPLE